MKAKKLFNSIFVIWQEVLPPGERITELREDHAALHLLLTFTFLTTLLLATVFLEGEVLFFDGLPLPGSMIFANANRLNPVRISSPNRKNFAFPFELVLPYL